MAIGRINTSKVDVQITFQIDIEILNPVSHGISASSQSRPHRRRNGRHRTQQTQIRTGRTPLDQLSQIGHLALVNHFAGKAGIHAINAQQNHFVGQTFAS